jgi:hypothetical protein
MTAEAASGQRKADDLGDVHERQRQEQAGAEGVEAQAISSAPGCG